MKSIGLILTLAASLMIFIAAAAEAGSETDPTLLPDFVGTNDTGSITLHKMVDVTGDVIYLSDLFMNVNPELANRVIAYAPEPGRQATFGARWLQRVAQYYRLDWSPQTPRIQSVITRESIIVEREQIEEAIMMHLVDQGVDPEMDAELANKSIRLFLPITETPDIAIDEMTFDKQTRRFTVIISAPANSPDAQRFRLSGRIYRMTDVPVLARQVSSNEVISSDDIEWKRMRSDQISVETALELNDLIGKSPKRGLRPGYPVRLSEVAAPIVVTKKSLVTIIFQHPFMTLTAKGRALQKGAVGDVIRITNVQSNVIVDAEIIGSGQAVVRSNELLAMNQDN